MTKDFSEQILAHLAQDSYQPKKARQLARALGVADAEYDSFRAELARLRDSGRVMMGAKNAVMLPEMTDRIVGVYRSNPRGFGFVVPTTPPGHEDLYIPERENLDAITGDTVVAKIVRSEIRGGKKMVRGRIVEVVARGQNRFVGTVIQVRGKALLEPDGTQLTDLVVLGDLTAKNARAGDKVVVELTQYPAAGRPAEGVIVEVLGPRGDPGVDTLSVIRQFAIPDRFPQEVLDQAGAAARAFEPDAAVTRGDRVDLRRERIITIDPATARDFDDAISLSRLPGGGWRLGVHIADVSHFVPAGSALDGEAHKRGNSVYFPQHVIPMLPESLSNSVCSLQQGEDRLTKSAFITYDANGRVLREEHCNSIIRSAQRLTYEQAQAVIDGRGGDGLAAPVIGLLRDMNELARVIQARRDKEGMLHLDLPKVELLLDENGKVVDARPEDDSFSHTLIEMFMVEANESVARLLDRLNLPFLRRVHPEPPADDFRQLSAFVRICGHTMPKKLDRFAMQRLLENAKGRPESYAINMALLRSLEQAVYSPKDEGHFALASRHYCHFTSPIRRYPDLHIHRLLDAHFAGQFREKRNVRAAQAEGQGLVIEGKHFSYTERRAEQAERELREVKVLELLSEHIGDHLQAVVTGVTGIGVFVQCSRYLVDGLIKFNDLSDDYWEVDTRAGAVVGMRSGRRIQVGDLLEVQITAVDLPRRELSLRMIKPAGRKGSMSDLMSDQPRAGQSRYQAPPRAHKKAKKQRGKDKFRNRNRRR